MRGGYWWLLAVTDGYRRLPAVTGGYRRLLRRSHEERRGGAPIDAVFALGGERAEGSARKETAIRAIRDDSDHPR